MLTVSNFSKSPNFKATAYDPNQRTQAPQRQQIDPRVYAQIEAQKKQNKREAWNKASTIAQMSLAAAFVAMAIQAALKHKVEVGRMLSEKQYYNKLIKKMEEQSSSGVSDAQRELGVKTKEEILKLYKDVSGSKSFDDIIMDSKLQETLDKLIDKIANAASYEEAKLEMQKFILFWGPAGTGKTTFVEALCKKLGVKPLIYDMGLLKGGYQGVTENNMRNLSTTFLEEHRAMRAKNPNHISILFFDECDEVFLEAAGANRGAENQTMTRFKRYLDEWKKEPGVFIFANTNKNPAQLNNAIRNRAVPIYIPCPPAEGLSNNFFKHFAESSTTLNAENLRKPTKKSQRFFEILAYNPETTAREFSYRDLAKIGWEEPPLPKGRPLELDDIIRETIKKNGSTTEFNFSNEELNALNELLSLTDDLLPRIKP